MDKIRLGRTELYVSRSSFGVLPIQRVGFDTAKLLLQKAYENGINFFDTARVYSDSEEKIGYSLSGVRKDIIIATKTTAQDKDTLFAQLETSLKSLKTDYIDIYQLHNPEKLPDPQVKDGLYQALVSARQQGMIRHIGITSHRLKVAREAVESGLYDTLQFPLSSLSSPEDLALAEECKRKDMGFIAMKALCGGLITKAASTFAFLRQFDHVAPIWGIQKESELDEFLALEKNPPALDEEMWRIIEEDRRDLAGAFCRGCGYCMPCPAGIPIPMAARMSFLLRRSPYQGFLEDTWKNQMELIDQCLDCGQCKSQCPYSLDTPGILKTMLADYREFYSLHKN